MSMNGMNYPMYNYPSMTQPATFYGQGFVSPSNASVVPPMAVPPSYPMYPNQTNSYDHIIRSAAETLAAFTRPSDNQTRRPINRSSSTATNSTRTFYCEICRIACGGQATYQAHLNGSKHKKKELNGQTPQSSTVNNYRCELCDITCTSIDAYKAHLEGSKHEKAMKLHRKLGKTIPDVELPLNNSTTTNPQEEKFSNESSMKLIGEEYIETTYDESRKPIVFYCKLCDCKFNDANAKDAHLKGKRHRISYRKKVDPNFQVEQNVSTTKKTTNDIVQENLSSTNEIDEETRCLMILHEQIIPSASFLNLLEQFVSAIESALKLSSDELRLSSFPTSLLGVSRVGIFAKSLLIKSDRTAQLVVMCSDWPTFDLIEKLLTILRKNFSETWRNRIEIRWKKTEENLQIETTDDDGTTLISSICFTSTIVETTNEIQRSTPNEFLSKTICLNSLKAIQSVRWFQSQVTIRQHASALIRCFRYKSFPSEIIEILIEFALSKRPSAVAAFRFVLEIIAGGILLDNYQSFSIEQRNEMTNEAQFALRLMSFGQLNRWFERNTTSVGNKRSYSDHHQSEISIKRPCFQSTENDEH